MKKLSNKGFTLVELIIVIAILAIIMMIAVPRLSEIRESSHVKADKATAAQIANAVRIWYTERDTEGEKVISAGIESGEGAGEQGITVLTKSGETYSGTPVPYGTLEGIEKYISPDYKPDSLANAAGTDIANGQFSVIMSSEDSTTAKIVVIAEEAGTAGEGVTLTKWSPAAVTEVTYTGKGAGVAYVEP